MLKISQVPSSGLIGIAFSVQLLVGDMKPDRQLNDGNQDEGKMFLKNVGRSRNLI